MASSKNSIGVKLIAKGTDPRVDIVAVHGLHGDAYKTWTTKPESPDEKEVMWLRDLLPAEVPNARILAYGYDSDPGKMFESASTNMVLHHATTLVSELHFYRRREHERRRPIIFVCHSLGGIVVKRALIYSNTCNLSHNIHLRSIKVSTYGILFLGTPHMGADLARWGKMAEMLVRMVSPKSWVDSNSALIKTLEKNSETLQNITDNFLGISRDFRMFFFWEELKTSIPGIGRELIVEYSSAVPEALPDAGRAAIHANHSDMCKFRDENSPGWNVLAGCLYDFVEQAPSIIERGWAQEQRRNLQATHDYVNNIIHNTEGRLSSHNLVSGSRASSQSGIGRITERGDVIQPDEISEFGIDFFESRNGSHNLLIKNTPFVKPLSLQENKYFEGREDELDIIHTILSDPHKRAVSISSVTGGGKTHLAREYFFHRKSNFPGGAFWIDCGPMKSPLSTESLDLGYCMIAEELGLANQQHPSGSIRSQKNVDPKVATRLEVRNWFDKHDGWLLVLDGANVETNDEVNVLSEYIPGGKGGSIILTTLNSAFAGSARLGSPERLELGKITGDEAVRMVLHYAQIKAPPETEIDAAHKLVEDLERNPLAIQSAGSYIKGKKVSVSDYWKKYEKRPFVEREFLEPFHIIFDRLDERKDRYEEAGNLLRLIAFLHREIPFQMLEFGVRHLPPDIKVLAKDGRRDLNNTIGHLLAYSLVDRGGGPTDNVQVDTLVLHSVVQDVCISRLRRKSGELKKWLELAILMYCSSFDTMESQQQGARFLVSDYRRYELHGVRLLEHANKYKVATGDLEKVLAKLTEAIRVDVQVDGPRFSMFASGSGSESSPETPSVSPESSRRPTWDVNPADQDSAEIPVKQVPSLAYILNKRREEWMRRVDEDTSYDTDTEYHRGPNSRRKHHPRPRTGDKPYIFRYEPPSGPHPWIPKHGQVPVFVKPPDSQLFVEDVTHSPRFDPGGTEYPQFPGATSDEGNIEESTSRRSLRALLRTPSGFSSLDPSLPRPKWPWSFNSPSSRSTLRSNSPTPSDMLSGRGVKSSSTFSTFDDAAPGSFSRGRSPVRRTRASLGSIERTATQISIPQSEAVPGTYLGEDGRPSGERSGPSSYPPQLRRQSTPANYPGKGGLDMPDQPLYSEIVSKPKPFSPGFSPSRDLSSSPIAGSIVGPRYDRPPSGAWSEPILEHEGDFSPRNSSFGSTSMMRVRSSTATGEKKSPRVAQLQASASGRGGGRASSEPMTRQLSGGTGPIPSGLSATALHRVVSEPWYNPSKSSPGLGVGGLHIPFGKVPEVTIAPYTPDYMISERSFRDGILGDVLGGDSGFLTGEVARSERRSSVPENGSEIGSTEMQRSKSEPDYITGLGPQQIRRRSPSAEHKAHKD